MVGYWQTKDNFSIHLHGSTETKLTVSDWNQKINSSAEQVSQTRMSLSLLVSRPCFDGRLWGALNELLIRLIRQQTKCGDVFGLQVIPRAPLTLRSLYRTSQRSHLFLPQMLIGPLGTGVVVLLLPQAGGHVAGRFLLLSLFLTSACLTVASYKVCTEHIKSCGTILKLLLALPERWFPLIFHHKNWSAKTLNMDF